MLLQTGNPGAFRTPWGRRPWLWVTGLAQPSLCGDGRGSLLSGSLPSRSARSGSARISAGDIPARLRMEFSMKEPPGAKETVEQRLPRSPLRARAASIWTKSGENRTMERLFPLHSSPPPCRPGTGRPGSVPPHVDAPRGGGEGGTPSVAAARTFLRNKGAAYLVSCPREPEPAPRSAFPLPSGRSPVPLEKQPGPAKPGSQSHGGPARPGSRPGGCWCRYKKSLWVRGRGPGEATLRSQREVYV